MADQITATQIGRKNAQVNRVRERNSGSMRVTKISAMAGGYRNPMTGAAIAMTNSSPWVAISVDMMVKMIAHVL